MTYMYMLTSMVAQLLFGAYRVMSDLVIWSCIMIIYTIRIVLIEAF